jgi:hypothetical protein
MKVVGRVVRDQVIGDPVERELGIADPVRNTSDRAAQVLRAPHLIRLERREPKNDVIELASAIGGPQLE